MDTAGIDAAGPWIERARTTHPALIDQAHLLGELLGVVNVPTGVWVDEQGIIVRPPEPAFPWRPRQPSEELLAQLPPLAAEQLREAQKITIDPDRYVAALRDWVAEGARSRYALSPEEVTSRSPNRSGERSAAAAAFELGQYLQRAGHRRRRGGVVPPGPPLAARRTGRTSVRRGRSPTRSRARPTSTTQTG